MPSGTPQDADAKFYTKISGFFQPNGALAPVVTTMMGPPGITITRPGPVGVFQLTLPAAYTPSVAQAFYMTFAHRKHFGFDPPIVGAMDGGSALPNLVFVTTTSTGVLTDFPLQTFERVIWELYIKYNTVLTF